MSTELERLEAQAHRVCICWDGDFKTYLRMYKEDYGKEAMEEFREILKPIYRAWAKLSEHEKELAKKASNLELQTQLYGDKQ